jgi:diguanylate cyclase (GGDEF)-like protein
MPNIDPLTGLFSAAHLERRLDLMIRQARQAGTLLSLILSDMGGLKQVNLRHGVETGDLVLRTVAKAMREAMDESFTCWRLGGDAFVIGMPEIGPDEAAVQSQVLRDAVSQLSIVAPDESAVRPTVSVGVSTYPEDAQTVKGLIRVADRRMQAAKALV